MVLIIPSFIDYYLIIKFLDINNQKRLSSKIILSLIIIMSFITDSTSKIFQHIYFIQTLLFFLIIPISYMIYEGNNIKITISFLYIFMIITISNFVFYFLFKSIVLKSKQNQDILFALLYYVFTRIFIYFYIIKKNKKNPVEYLQINYKNLIIKIILILFLLILVAFLFINLELVNKENMIKVSSIIIIILIILIYLLFQEIMEEFNEVVKMNIIKTNSELSINYLKMIDEKILELSVLNHNINEHLVLIKYYVNEKKYKELNQYMDNMEPFLPSFSKIKLAQIPYLTSLIDSKINSSKKYGIEIIVNNLLTENYVINIKEIDIILIVGNMLDNAIDALKSGKVKSKKIVLSISEREPYIMIDTVNEYIPENIFIKRGKLKTSKTNNFSGNGIEIITQIAQRYNGFFDFNLENESIFINVTLDNNKPN